MRFFKILLIAVLALCVIGLSAFLYIKQTHSPSTDTEYQLVGLDSEATVHFDEFGIPHIYAENDQDAWRALGYVHARDRLFQMDVLRRVGGGRLAELFGDDVLKIDRLFRTLGTEESAQQAAKEFMSNQTEEWQIQAQAYVDGINAYRASNPKPVEYTILGLEPEPFEVVDMYRVVGYMSFSFAMALKTDPLVDKILHKLGKEYLESFSVHSENWHPRMPSNNLDTTGIDSADASLLTTSVHEALNSLQIPLFEGSNSWVIGSKKSKSGKVLFANDTHINYAQPSVWYEAHIETPTTRLYGNFLAGFPYPLVGHTNHHSWGLTMFENDDMDLYREKIDGENVMYKGALTAMNSRLEKVKSSSGKEIEFTVLTTPHGPIINGILDDKTISDSISCFWTFREFPLKVIQVAHGFQAAKSMDEFKSLLPDLAAPGLNVMYGDADGNYAWWGTAKILKRPEHVNPKTILDGSTGEDDAIGYYDFDENPRSVNDERGFVHSANNAPEDVNGRYVFGYYYAGQRSEQIMKKIAAEPLWDMEMMKTLALDDESPWYPTNAKIMLENVKTNSDFEAQVFKSLNNWDGKHSLDQHASIIYYQMLYQTLKLALHDDLGKTDFDSMIHTLFYLRSVRKFLETENNPWWDLNKTEVVETRKMIFQAAFIQTAQTLREALGDDISAWKWSDVHQLTHEHPMGKVPVLGSILNVGPIEIAGGEEVINKQSFWIDNGVNYPVKSGPAMRILIDFNDVENALSINPTGQSGNPFSAHYQDQAEMFASGQWRKMRMNKADIEANTEQMMVLKP
jgi:penicillin G amidase